MPATINSLGGFKNEKLVCVLSLLMIAAAVACGVFVLLYVPARSPEDAVQLLKERGYEVSVESDGTIVGKSIYWKETCITVNYCEDEESAKKAYQAAVEKKEAAEQEAAELKEMAESYQANYEAAQDEETKKAWKLFGDLAKALYDVAERRANCEVGRWGNVVWAGYPSAVKSIKMLPR